MAVKILDSIFTVGGRLLCMMFGSRQGSEFEFFQSGAKNCRFGVVCNGNRSMRTGWSYDALG